MIKATFKTIALAALLSLPQGQSAFARSTTEVWAHHIEAWEARSVEDIVSDYSDDSVLVLNNQTFEGRDQIAHVFTQLFKIFDAGVNRIDTPILFDRFVYITWNYTPTGNHEFFGTDTFVIEDGKISLQTIASTLYNEFPVSSQGK
jgi:predicted SnoaL-like aldol condensation-catalyzing enzyme